MSTSAAAAGKPTPWGVSLKKTPGGRNPVPNTRRTRRLSKDIEKVEENIQNRRASLRPTQTRPRPTKKAPKKTYTRPASRGWKLRDTSTPLFGVVLRRLGTIQEDEEFCDLDLMAVEARTNATAATSATTKPNLRSFGKNNSGAGLDLSNHSTGSLVASSFGVRLKPNRNARCTKRAPSRTKSTSVAAPPLQTYQIDLNPTQKSNSGKDKSFLEVKLRPVQKPVPPNDQVMVEFQLRHVVAPANGGPHQTASQALFQVPLLKPLASAGQRQNWKPTTLEGMQDLLQIGISNLKPPVETGEGITLQSIQIQATQVDPETQETRTMEHVIDVELKHKEGDVEAKENSTVPSWTMKVELKSAKDVEDENENNDDDLDRSTQEDKDKGGLDSDPKVSISVKPVTKPTKSDDSDSSDEDNDDDDGFAKEEEGAMLDCDYDSVHSSDEEDEFEDEEIDEYDEEEIEEFDEEEIEEFDEEEIEEYDEEEIVEVSTAATAESTEHLEADTANDNAKKEEEPEPKPEPEEKKKEETPVEDKKKEEEKVEISQAKKKDLAMWYNRMKCPNKKEMIRKVKKLPADCDITPEDVEALPWLRGGFFLDQKILNQMIMDDWQGEEKK